MTKDEAIKVLEMVEAHGLAKEAKEIAIEALKTEAIPVDFIQQQIWLWESLNEFTLPSFYYRELIGLWREKNNDSKAVNQ